MNVVHPRPTSWNVILKGIHEELGGQLPIVPLNQWVAKLDTFATNPTAEDLTAIVSSPYFILSFNKF